MPSIHGPLTLGELIEKLEATFLVSMPDEVETLTAEGRPVYFDWCQLAPGKFNSYRGYYDHLAISIEKERSWTSRTFLDYCKTQIGARHEGWKGGDYEMDADTPVWVANPGHCPGFGVADVVVDDGYYIIIVAKKFDH